MTDRQAWERQIADHTELLGSAQEQDHTNSEGDIYWAHLTLIEPRFEVLDCNLMFHISLWNE